MTASERDVRMPGAQIRFQSNGEGGFLRALVQLKKMRMTCADTDPDNLWHASWRKCSDAFDWQNEGAKLNGAEFFAQGKIHIRSHVRKEAERKMHLITCDPAHAFDSRVKIDQYLFDRGWQIDRNKEARCLHFAR